MILKKMPLFIIILLAFLGLHIYLESRVAPKNRKYKNSTTRFKQLSIREGLSNSMVNCIIQDAEGFMWFGTEDGLNRSDSYALTIYRFDPDNPGSISRNDIQTLYIDSSGTLWIGTSFGLHRFNKETETFSNFNAGKYKAKETGISTVNTILESQVLPGTLWLTISGELYKFIIAEEKFQRPNQDSVYHANELIESVSQPGKIFAAAFGTIKQFDCLTETFDPFFNDKKQVGLSQDKGIWCLFQSTKKPGILWAGSDGHGLYRLDFKDKTIKNFKHSPGDPGSLSENKIWAISESIKEPGALWIATYSGGVNKFNTKTGKSQRFEHTPGNLSGLKHNRVKSVYCDAGGSVWVGTASGGVNHYDPQRNKFTLFQHRANAPHSLSHNIVMAICEDPEENVWLGTNGGGLNKYNRQTGTFTHYHHHPGNPNSLSHDFILAVHCDHHGNLWVGTNSGGLNRFDPRTGNFKRFRHDPNDNGSLGNDLVFFIHEDTRNTLWIGTNHGLNRLDPETGNFLQFDTKNPGAYLATDCIFSVYEDSTGHLWFGTWNSGLFCVNPKDKLSIQYYHEPENANSISSNKVFAIHESQRKHGIIWIGTGGSGLNRLDCSTGTFTLFREQEGLPNNMVYGILEDNYGNLWLSTAKGLSRFNPVTRDFKNFDEEDGLQSDEFSEHAYFQSKKGEMFFGGIEGFNVFFPDDILENNQPPPVVIVGTEIRNVPKKHINNKSITRVRVIDLTYLDTSFSFQFAALDYTAPGKNRYSYKMEGFDKYWNDIGTRRFVNFTNLDAGKYTFRVRACNNDGLWNEAGTGIKIRISPPPWKTWWAYTLYLLGLIAILSVGYILRVRVLTQRQVELAALVKVRTHDLSEKNKKLKQTSEDLHWANEELQKVNEMKSQLLGIAAHDLKEPLQVIHLYVDVLRSRIGNDRFVSEKLEVIDRNSQRMLNHIVAILENAAIESGKLKLHKTETDFLLLSDQVVKSLIPSAEKKKQDVIFTHDNVDPRFTVIEVDKLIIQQVMLNLLSNAIKFSKKERQIRVESSWDAEGVSYKVTDEGPGLTDEDKSKLFVKFQRLSASPTGGECSTGLGLSLVKEFVALHNGSIEVESEVGVGSSFKILLPRTGEPSAPETKDTN
ncbi:MAG: hypothetical protein GY757_45395 [bacterium]|nr:hypothetical protein [bacterium]